MRRPLVMVRPSPLRRIFEQATHAVRCVTAPDSPPDVAGCVPVAVSGSSNDSCGWATWIDHVERGGERPSDHAALIADLELNGPG